MWTRASGDRIQIERGEISLEGSSSSERESCETYSGVRHGTGVWLYNFTGRVITTDVFFVSRLCEAVWKIPGRGDTKISNWFSHGK
jgi:hypothetical protein